MKLLDKISMAFKDLMNRKVRSILTITAVSIGSLLLIVMMGLSDGIVNKLRDMLSGFGNTNIVQVYPIDSEKMKSESASSEIKVTDVGSEEQADAEESEDDQNSYTKKILNDNLDEIKDIDGVEKVSAYAEGNITEVMLNEDKRVNSNISIKGYDFNNYIDISDKLATGSTLKNEDSDIIISEDLVSKLGSDNDQILNKNIKVKAEYPEVDGIKVKEPKIVEGIVVGVVKKSDFSNSVIMSGKKADPILAYYTNKDSYIDESGYSLVDVYAKDGKDLSKLSASITSTCGYYTFSYDMINKTVDVLGSVVKAILSIAGIIVLIVAALGLVNTVSMTLQEKRKMIGVMRSVGGSKSNIRNVFTFQSIIIGLSGGVLGVVFSAIGIFVVNEYVTKSSNFSIPLTAFNVLISLGITVLMSVIAGAIPATKAARINVVEAVAEE